MFLGLDLILWCELPEDSLAIEGTILIDAGCTTVTNRRHRQVHSASERRDENPCMPIVLPYRYSRYKCVSTNMYLVRVIRYESVIICTSVRSPLDRIMVQSRYGT